jgi:tetratricopeptide (TPR) repeat protein
MDEIRKAFDAVSAGQVDEALRLCREILASKTGDARSLGTLSLAMLKAGRAAEADALAALALAERPEHPDLLALRGRAAMQLGREADALAFLEQATERRPVFPHAQAGLCEVLAQRADPTPRYSVCIVTASIGGDHLSQTLDSVQAQTYPHLEHYVVVDGPKYRASVEARLPARPRHPVHVLELPFNVGAGRYNGHRAYAAATFLVNTRFIAFVDEDNWLEPGHVEALMSRITAQGLEWAYALRNVVDEQGAFLVRDDCESLGLWPTWDDATKHLVDVNCYVLRRDIAIAVSPLWYRRVPDDVSPDFLICERLLKEYPRFATSGDYSVNYRAGMTSTSVRIEYFQQGNAQMARRYGSQLPWRAAAGGAAAQKI